MSRVAPGKNRFLVRAAFLGGLAVLMALLSTPLLQGSSVAEANTALKTQAEREFNKFDECLKGLLTDAEPLADGRLARQLEEIAMNLSSIETRMKEQLEILAKKRERLASLGLDEADRKDLQTALKEQMKPLEALLENNQQMLKKVKIFKEATVQEWAAIYSSFRDVVGEESAKEKLADKVKAYRSSLSTGPVAEKPSSKPRREATQAEGKTTAPSQHTGNVATMSLGKLKKAASQGNSEAQTALGIKYRSGSGVPRDTGQAFYWLQRAANAGNAKAQYHLGIMYRNGEGVGMSYADAKRWLQRASKQGYAPARAELAKIR